MDKQKILLLKCKMLSLPSQPHNMEGDIPKDRQLILVGVAGKSNIGAANK
jgi:hypothetical protein